MRTAQTDPPPCSPHSLLGVGCNSVADFSILARCHSLRHVTLKGTPRLTAPEHAQSLGLIISWVQAAGAATFQVKGIDESFISIVTSPNPVAVLEATENIKVRCDLLKYLLFWAKVKDARVTSQTDRLAQLANHQDAQLRFFATQILSALST